MKRGTTDAETCRLNGWDVGTRLVGDEGYGPTVIRITAIGDERILAIRETHNGEPPQFARENVWTLTCREWEPVGGNDRRRT
jgi:hypothetical protein